MSFWKDLQDTESKIETVILASGQNAAIDSFQTGFSDRVLSILDDYTLDELADMDIPGLVSDAMSEYKHLISKDLMDDLSGNIKKAVSTSLKFYENRGVDITGVYDEVKRSKAAAQLTRTFSDSLRNSYSDLRRGTVTTLQEAILSGTVVRSDIESQILQFGDIAKHHARTESQAVVSAYNQYSRNVVRDKAGLTHGLYYGHLQQNSRHFCRSLIMKTFTLEQINAMDNGMLNPVRVHRGGYRCIHSWVWVNPEWDDKLKPESGGSVRRVSFKKQAIKVYTNKAKAKRLKWQMELGNKGFGMFRDSQVNDTGFSALHSSWYTSWMRSRKPLKNEFKMEYEAGLKLSDLGYEALFDRRILNNLESPVDIILNGVPMEIKTPTMFNAKTVFNRIRKSKKGNVYQGDDYIINLLEPMPDVERMDLLRQISDWYNRHPDKTVYILHQYDNLYYEEIKR